MKYLFGEWGAIKDKIKGKRLFIFLDFDGTLVPLAPAPDKAVLSPKTKAVLRKLAGKPALKLAFISGRTVGNLKNKIGLKNVIYSGNHGLEIEGPKINFKPRVPPGYRRIIERIKNDLERRISPIEGAFVEDKGLSLSLHFRLINKSLIPLLKTVFHEAVTAYLARNEIRIKPGKMVFEVRPPVKWDKGKAVLWLLRRQMSALKDGAIVPIYIGDDVSDEDAFKALKNKGLTIFVGEHKNSCARHYLRDHDEVSGFLGRISKGCHERINKS
ncbi:MAG: trehalose-phosphatase [Candidatus Omnitrophota bacterium]|jgi:trehalose-phosphatase